MPFSFLFSIYTIQLLIIINALLQICLSSSGNGLVSCPSLCSCSVVVVLLAPLFVLSAVDQKRRVRCGLVHYIWAVWFRVIEKRKEKYAFMLHIC